MNATHERPVDDLRRADAFRSSILDRADSHHGPAPLWHGWAIMAAYLAGLDHGRLEAMPADPMNQSEKMCDVERAHIERIIFIAKNREKAAKILGIPERTLYRKIRQFGIKARGK